MWKTLQKRFGSSESYVSMILGIAVIVVIGTLIYSYMTRKTQAPGISQETGANGEEKLTSLPTIHIVIEGETLWDIAEKYYKSGYNWEDLQRSNNIANADYIETGQKLTIPVVTPIIPQQGELTSAAASVLAPQKKTYTVVAGDSLWQIAINQYQDGFMWSNIAKANNLVNPNLIHPRNVFVLP